ncbi:SCO1860 family LAETG-anchored protein [Streptomyces tanashiensis]|uniref:PT domain-containing protein n=1 Tax=Streptomyces tanashiensis TaxID=67367 RepID=A0ABY6R3R8_9ACTN|nr:SCO1860 family LAETG-anchored protein [Streptomyces tanashiensis]UZX24680.1 PT domain-containing protein [Streptomyces tanashiensis]GGY14811.1 LPXTG cell wall anchor domain-containing protein [Streptomyces tanashiensis]
MNSNTFRMPVRRSAAAATVAALAVGPVLLAAPAAHATGGEGRATAVVLRAGLDVSLLGKTVNVPVRASLNEVKAPESENETALSVKVQGAEGGEPIDILKADVATADATVDEKKAEGYVNLVKAQVHVPGIPLLSLVEVEKVTSKALCEVGKKPVAESNVLGHVTVFGKKTTLSAAGRTQVSVPGVGEVTLDLSRTSTTSRTAAATALELKVEVNPLKLGVAEVNGTVTLAQATCETPKGTAPTEKPTEKPTDNPTEKPTERPSEQPSVKPSDAGGIKTDNGGTTPTENLAETGGSSTTPYIAAGALALLVAGGGALVVTRSRARSRG